MPSIYLNKTTDYTTLTPSGFEKVYVSRESYPTSNMFTRHKHKFKPPMAGTILIYNDKLSQESNSLTFDFLGNHLTLNLDRTYQSSNLREVYVYFNKYDSNAQHPLLLVLLFAKSKPPVENKYYTRSDFETKIGRSDSVDISTLKRYENDQDILADLIKENYRLPEPLTFDIGKTQGEDESNEIFSNTYDNNKIIIEDISKGDSSGPNSGFKRHTHKYDRSQTGKNACIIYNNNLLIGEDKSSIESIQNKPYDHINVYWSNKVAEPLLIEFNTNQSRTNTNEFYYYTRHSDDSFIWKKVNISENVLGVQFDQNEINGFSDTNSRYSDNTIKLLKAIESHLQKTILFMVDKRNKYEQSTFKTSFDKSSNYRLINQPITPTDKTSLTEGKCLDKTGFKVYEHDFTTSVSGIEDSKEKVELKFIIPSSDTPAKYQEIKLYKSESTISRDAETLEYKSPNKNLYVYFYGEKDPRPLLVCYNGCAYKPRNLNSDHKDKETQVNVKYSIWEKVTTISTCTCQNGGTSGQNQQILKALTQIAGFLNPVQINPNQIPGSASSVTKEPLTSPVKVEYKLHTYIPGTTIKMGISRSKVDCYDKYTYEPNGTSKDGNGFRLGCVIYHENRTGGSTLKGTLQYTSKGHYKHHPLVKVTVYYYDHDKDYKDPLLISLQFKVEWSIGIIFETDYWKLIKNDGTSNLEWELDRTAKDQIGYGVDTQKLVDYLDTIRYSLKPVIKILIEKQVKYNLKLSREMGGSAATYTPDNGNKQIQVTEYKENGCEKLEKRGYKCYVHKVSTIPGGFDYNTIGGLKFYISGKGKDGGVNGDQDIPIPLHGEDDTQIKELLYNTCMGDVYVYFYAKHSTKSADDVPLMLRYNNGYYRPEERDTYFTNWIHESWFDNFKNPCGSEGDDARDSYVMLLTMLDFTNQELNRIDLDGNKVTHGKYGLPAPGNGKELSPDFNTERVTVTCQNGPSKQPISNIYKRIIHRTVNGYRIGYIYYDNKDIVENGEIEVNGGSKISIEGSDHNQFTDDNKPNTVVAYYHTEDKTHKLPQLIVLMNTPKPISVSTEPITATSNTKYGYYVLATGTGGSDYKYEWRTDATGSQLKLDEKTEFSLLNSLVILVDKQELYQESAIQAALTNSKTIRSPGNESGVNRLTGKSITVNGDTSNDGGKCVSTYGYVLKSHDLTAITAKIHGINPILGLRFLIPSSTSPDGYDEIKLHYDENALNTVGPLYHTTSINTVYVYFYGKDPRPLLMCFGNDSYIPKKTGEPTVNKQVNVDYKKWTNVDTIKQCMCNGETSESPNTELLDTLLKVVLFLNPVQINPRKLPNVASYQITKPLEPPKTPKNLTYNLHKFTFNHTVKMKITRDDVKCYEKYTYQPDGTSSNGGGFRLGTVIYTSKNNSIKTLDYPNEIAFLYDPLVKVTVYYYDHDKQYEDPLLIQLDFTKIIGSGTQINLKEYYKLTKNDTSIVDWQLDPDAQKHIGNGEQEKVVNYLDKIRYQFKKILQVCIAIKKTKSYDANLLNKDNDKSAEPKDVVQVQVTEETNCPSLTGTGFRCFKHGISSLDSQYLHKFAALQLVIPNQQGDQVKLNLYDTSPKGLLNQLYYNCSMGDIYVYFYGKGNRSGGTDQNDGDPRPLLLCYNNKAYRAWSMTTYDSQIWLNSSDIKDCASKSVDNKHLNDMVSVSNFLNPVNIKMDQLNSENTGTYKIHKFNGHDINIKVTKTPGSETFCYTSYTHKHEKDGFRLGRIDYGSDTHGARSSKCIKLTGSTSGNGEGTCINAVLDDPSNKYTPASQVIVYYFSKDTSHEIPLLVVLCNNGDCTSGTASCTCKSYYELQRDSTNEPKKYTKYSNDLSLDTTKNGQLETLLDKRLSGMSKSLQIILGKRLDPIQLCPIERKRIKLSKTATPLKELDYPDILHQLYKDAVDIGIHMSQAATETILSSKNPKSYEYINKGFCQERENNEWDPKIKTRTPFYKARVYKNDGKPEQGTSEFIQIKVKKIESIELANTGYVCYKHKLLNIPNINEFNGLRLFLWDNRTSEDDGDQCKITKPTTDTKPKCCELDLYEDGTCSTSTKIEPIAYTTCKGDLYVYFYGSDPRPMLLCYNGQGYAPSDLQTYSEKWCLVSSIKSCECDKTGFKPEQLLQQLYKTSMFLNPVRLWETLEAYKKVKDVIDKTKYPLQYLIQI